MFLYATLRHGLNVNYIKKGIGQTFFDYLGPTYFNCLNINFKKHLRVNNNININKSSSNFYLSEL